MRSIIVLKLIVDITIKKLIKIDILLSKRINNISKIYILR